MMLTGVTTLFLFVVRAQCGEGSFGPGQPFAEVNRERSFVDACENRGQIDANGTFANGKAAGSIST
jgi:hypothetical protein